MKPENNHSKRHCESILKASDPTIGPDREFLAQLRELSAREFEAAGTAQSLANTEPQRPLSPWRFIMKKRSFQYSAAAILLFAIVAAIQFMPGQSLYAQVVNQLQNARTLAYTLIQTTNPAANETVTLKVMYKAPNSMRTEAHNGYICILDNEKGRMISLVPDAMMYIDAEYKNLPETQQEDPFSFIRRMESLPQQANEKLGIQEINGVRAEGFRVSAPDVTTTIWIDVAGRELVRIQQEYPNAPGMNSIMQDIKLDSPLDDALFSLEPPAGYNRKTELSADGATLSEENLLQFFRTWIDNSADKTYPPTFWTPDFAKTVMDYSKAGKFSRPWTGADAQIVFKGIFFLNLLPQKDWSYLGHNLPFGDSKTPILWYKPQGSSTCRVIYADLSVKDAAPADLPQ